MISLYRKRIIEKAELFISLYELYNLPKDYKNAIKECIRFTKEYSIIKGHIIILKETLNRERVKELSKDEDKERKIKLDILKYIIGLFG